MQLIQTETKNSRIKKKRTMSFFKNVSLFLSVWLIVYLLPAFSGACCLWGLLVVFIASRGRERRRESAHASSFTITWKFPAKSRLGRTLYSVLVLIFGVAWESSSVTKQITVYCSLSRMDRACLTAETLINGPQDSLPPQPHTPFSPAPHIPWL